MEVKASIPGWPDYMITNTATVLSYKGKGRVEHALKSYHGNVSLRRAGRTYTRSVHQLMVLAFWAPPDVAATHCAAGHPYSRYLMPPLRARPRARRCRKCHAQAMARWRAKKRANAIATGTA